MIIVGKHINDITINPLEYLLDDDGDVREFKNEESAKIFLKDNGFTDDDIYWLTFQKQAKTEGGQNENS